MTRRSVIPAAPVGQQGPPARAAASAMGARRGARGSLLLTTGTGLSLLPDKPERLVRSQCMLDEHHRY